MYHGEKFNSISHMAGAVLAAISGAGDTGTGTGPTATGRR